MVFGKTKIEFRVGFFAFIGLVILITFVLLIGDFKTWGSSRKVNIIFNFVNGVKLGAPVRFSGVDVGQVKEINFFFSPEEQKSKVKVTGLISKEVNIPIDSKVWVNTLGLLGEKYIEIIPGKDYQNLLADNQDLKGNDPIAMHEVAELAKSIADNLNESINKLKNKEGTLGKLLYDDGIYKQIEAILNSKEGTVGKLLRDDAIYKELEALISDIRQHPWKLFWKGKEEKPLKK